MTIRKKNNLNTLSLIMGLVFMVGFSNWSLNEISDKSVGINEITEKYTKNSQLIKEHERKANDLLVSFINQEDYKSQSYEDCELTKWIEEVKSEEDYTANESVKESILAIEENHKKIHNIGKKFNEEYKKYDHSLEKEILEKEIHNLNTMSELNMSLLEKRVSKIDDKFHFADWYNVYVVSDKMKLLPASVQMDIKSLGENQKALFDSVQDVKKLQKSGDFAKADNEFKTKTLKHLMSTQTAMEKVRTAAATMEKTNKKIKNLIENDLAVNLNGLIEGLENYEAHLKTKRSVLNEDRDSTTTNGQIGLWIMSFMAALVVYWAVKIGREVLCKIEEFQEGITSFFKYMNKETDEVTRLKEAGDEVGEMSKMVNRNIDSIVENLKDEDELIKKVNELVSKIKDGDLRCRVDVKVNNEGLDRLQRELNNMVEEMENKMGSDINKLNEVLNDFSNYDFRSKVGCEKGEVAKNIDKLGELIQEMLMNNQLNAEQLMKTSRELKNNISELSMSSNEQAANLEEVAASIEEISGNIRNNGEKSNVLQTIAQKMGGLTGAGTIKIKDMTEMIEKVAESQTAIDEAIKVIDQIAFQTNILSLNAAVEAATAGEHGRGFAVVATEVRNLASKSAEAANEIKELVTRGTNLVHDSTNLSKEVNESFDELVKSINDTSEYIKEITEATNEQSLAITQIAETMSSLDTMTQNNASMASRTNDIGDETTHIAQAIQDDIQDKEFNGKYNSENNEDKELI